MSNEIVSHDINNAQEIARFFEANKQLEDPVQRRDYFEHLDEDEFLDLVQQTAGLVRTGNAVNQYFDGENMILPLHDVPDQREKEQLLRETWCVAKTFLSNTHLPDDDALDFAALTVAGGLLYAHPFDDSNGRTSRILSYMISQGYGDKEELHKMLESDGRFEWQVTPIPLVVRGQSVFKGKQPEKIEWDRAPINEANDALEGMIANNDLKDVILRKFIEKYGHLTDSQIEESMSHTDDRVSVLNGQNFIANLVSDPEVGVTNARELLKLRRETRADYVHRFLEAMLLHEKIMPVRIRQEDLELADTDTKLGRSRKQMIIKQFGKRSVNGLLTPAEQQLVQHFAYSRIRRRQD